ncbi:hypothetical protein ACFSKW_06435 [Nonomuraea mangrovi]|uniref:Histidine kinase n=1 Tax=Nonomuraea mangrovi TaxID=2316207 RepID=A0ABW4SQ99_9ACTN
MPRVTERGRRRAAGQIERRLLRGVRGSVLAVTAAVQFGLCLPELVRSSARYDPLWLEVAGFALLVGVTLVAAIFVVRGRGVPPAVRWVCVGLVLVAVVAASSAAPSHRIPDAANWSFGLVGWYGVLLLFDLPLGYLGAFLGANLALAVVQAVVADLPGPRTMASMALSAVSIYGFQFAFGLVVHAVRRVAVRASEAAEEEERIRTEEAVADHTHLDHQRRYAALLGTTVPLLVGLGYGSLDPSDQDTRRRCAHEAARMRRLFAESDDVSDRLLHELRAVIDVAERHEVTVQLAVRGEPTDLPKEVRRELIDAVTAVLSAASSAVVATPEQVRVTVVRTPEQVRVSAVGDVQGEPPPEFEFRHVEVNRVAKGNRLWVETVWRLGTPSRSR